jgi:hypothetical protein
LRHLGRGWKRLQGGSNASRWMLLASANLTSGSSPIRNILRLWYTKAVQRVLRLDASCHGLYFIGGQAQLTVEGGAESAAAHDAHAHALGKQLGRREPPPVAYEQALPTQASAQAGAA